MGSLTTIESRRVWLAMLAGVSLVLSAGCGGPPSAEVAGLRSAARVDNPFAGVKGYVNPDWRANVLAESSGNPVADQPTAIWLDSIGSITARYGGTSLRQHFDAALEQGAGYIQIVLDDLPGRRCEMVQLDGDLAGGALARYQTEFIDAIAAIEGDSKYAGLRVINIVEPDSLPNLVVNVGTDTATDACATAKANGDYVKGIQYALSKLGALPNVYNYLDVANHAVLGWSNNFSPAVNLFTSTVKGATGGFATVAGIATNVASYAATVEPFFTPTTLVGGVLARQSKWVDWNDYADEQSYVLAMRKALVNAGFSSGLGAVIDTSRNGWGGVNRPTGPSKSTDVNTFVNESRIDRRYHAGNWCNQKGSGLGERPRAIAETVGLHAYAWIKPPGESDGASTAIVSGTDNPAGKGYDLMCDPNAGGAVRNGYSQTGALPNAPVEGRWFSAFFQQLLANQYPTYACATAPVAPTGLVATIDGSTQITLTWTPVASSCNPVTYSVFRGGTQVASGLTGSKFTDTGLSPSTTYSYTVLAVYGASVSMKSEPVGATTLSSTTCTTIPSKPTNVSYTTPASWQTKLTWSAVIAPASCTVTYGVLRNDQVIASGLTEANYLDTSSLSGVASVYRIVAIDDAGKSVPSDPASAAVCLAVMPSMGEVTAKAVSSSEIDLSWTSFLGCYAKAVTYDVFRSASKDFTPSASNRVATGLMGTSLADKELPAGTTYYYVVELIDSGSLVSTSGLAVATTLGAGACTTVPSKPTNVIYSTPGSTQTKLSWTAVTAPPNCTVTYSVLRNDQVIASGLTQPNYVDPTAPSSVATIYRIVAVDEAGKSVPSDPASAGGCLTVMPAVGTLLAKGASSSEIDLSWTVILGCYTGTVTFDVFRSATPDITPSASNRVATGLTLTSFADTGLAAGTTYYYVVQALYTGGLSSSGRVAANTLGAQACTAVPATPTGLATRTASATQVALVWTAVTPPAGCSVTYRVARDGVVIATGIQSTTYTDSNPGSPKSYTVAAEDAAGTSAPSTPVYFSCVALAPSLQVTATAVTAGQINLSWSVSPSCGPQPTSYDLFMSTTKGFTPSDANLYTAGIGAVIAGISVSGIPSTTYYFVVRAHFAGYALDANASATTPAPTAGLKLQYRTSITAATSSQLGPQLKIVNKGKSSILLAQMMVRYFFTAEGTAAVSHDALQYVCDFASRGCAHVHPMLSGIDGQKCVQLNFDYEAGSLEPGQSAEVQGRIFQTDWSKFNQKNDFSFDARKTSYADWDHVALYVDGVLVWGQDPMYGEVKDTTPPSAPTGLMIKVTGIDGGYPVLTWTASTDDVGVAGYDVYAGTKLVTSVTTTDTGTALSTLASGTYSFTVKAKDKAGNVSAASAALSVTIGSVCLTAPSAPTNLVAKFVGSREVILAWDPPPSDACFDATTATYQILAGSTPIGSSNSTSATVANLLPSTAYTFSVKAVDLAGNVSVASSALALTTLSETDTTPPSVPTGLSFGFVASSPSYLMLTWTASTDDVGVAGYDVYAGTKLVASVTGTNTGTALSTLGVGTISFTVRAKDLAGNVSAASAPRIVTISPECWDLPPYPTNIRITIVSPTAVTISWTPPPASDCYDVTSLVYEISSGSARVARTSGNSVTISKLQPSATYTFTLRVADVVGNVYPASTPFTVTMPLASDTTPPSVPTDLYSGLSGIDGGYPVLSWKASTDDVGVVGYDVYSGTTLVASVTTTDTGSALSTLAYGDYVFTVKARDLAGNVSAASAPRGMTVGPICFYPPSAPTNVTVNPLVYTDTLVSWSPSQPSSGCTPIVSYSVYVGTTLVASSTGTSVTVKGLATGTYSFTVRAADAAGNLSAASTPVSYTVILVEPPTPPTTPTNVVVSRVTALTADLSWTASVHPVGVVAYYIYSGTSSTPIATSYPSATLTKLLPNTTYSVTIKALAATGVFSAASTPVTFQTLPATDTTPPSAPTELVGTALSATSAALSWTASTDDMGVVVYDVYMGSNLAATTQTTSAIIANLIVNVGVNFTVRARDLTGNVSAPSNAVFVPGTVESEPPSTPGSLVATSFGTGVVLTWNASIDYHGQPVAKYDLYIGEIFVGTTTVNAASVIGLAKGVPYAFAVRAVDVEGNASSLSNAVTVTF